MIRTWTEACQIWRAEELPHVKATFEVDGIPDYPARVESWNNWTDAMRKSRQITSFQYTNRKSPRECTRPARRP